MFRQRFRAIALWTATALCALIAAAFVVSGWYHFAVQFGHFGCLYVIGGSVTFLRDDPLSEPFGFDRHFQGFSRWDALSTDWAYSFEAPLLTILAAVALPTLLLLRAKPPRPGHCRCGYDLRGNTSGVCPECGAEV